MLKLLKEQFATYNLLGADDRQTNFNLGMRALVDYLIMMDEADNDVLEQLTPDVKRRGA